MCSGKQGLSSAPRWEPTFARELHKSPEPLAKASTDPKHTARGSLCGMVACCPYTFNTLHPAARPLGAGIARSQAGIAG